jgi:hypothetical protein
MTPMNNSREKVKVSITPRRETISIMISKISTITT